MTVRNIKNRTRFARKPCGQQCWPSKHKLL